MGMAASQARYLALVARKSNCEYEGQQINQARLNLSNQSANLFNQMLGLSVPVPPSTQDYTKTQYSFTDGVNNAVIDSWNQLAEADSEGYNYVVNYHYNANVYTGSQKKMNDPQVQFSWEVPASSEWESQISTIQQALEDITAAKKDVEDKEEALNKLLTQASRLSTYADKNSYKSGITATYDDNNKQYLVYGEDTTNTNPIMTLTAYSASGSTQETIDKYVENLKTLGVDISTDDIYASADGTIIAFKSDLEALKPHGTSEYPNGSKTGLTIYRMTGKKTENYNTLASINQDIAKAKQDLTDAQATLETCKENYDALSVPSYIGNNQLTPLEELTEAQAAEIKQVIKDMQELDVNTTLTKCFENGTYSPNDYTGGIYSFVLNGVTYYATYYDLAQTASEGDGINHIDDQPQLPYYNASYINTRIEKQEKAILETDSSGRFVSVRLGDDTVKYTLNVETITDDAAYEDAMNKYYYENAKYDKMVQEINAKTSIIQVEDRTLELRLKQLDTEQNALSTEIDAVSKVVKDNVEKSFKTFGG